MKKIKTIILAIFIISSANIVAESKEILAQPTNMTAEVAAMTNEPAEKPQQVYKPVTAEEIIMEKMYPSDRATIISGEKEAKQNIITQFLYEENKIYNIYCRVNNITTILLNPDENIVSVQAGDTARWDLVESQTGSSEGGRTAILVKPLSYNEKLLKTTLMILTDKRFYTFNLVSAKDWYNPVVKFLYPRELKQALNKKINSEENLYKTDPSKLNYKYTVNTKRYDFVPSTIFDDGTKTFLVMKNEIQEMPAFYVKEGKELFLVNYRVKGNYIIIDRTFDEGVLQLGKKKVIIKRKG